METATGASTPLPAEPSYKPPQLDRPLAGGAASADGTKLLFATNSHTVVIRKTASDYWVLDKSDNSWHKIGSKSPAGLMFAKFSPDGTRVAYLADIDPVKNADTKWNLYVEDRMTGAAIQLSSGASGDIIDGTFDWNNNEEFSLLEDRVIFAAYEPSAEYQHRFHRESGHRCAAPDVPGGSKDKNDSWVEVNRDSALD